MLDVQGIVEISFIAALMEVFLFSSSKSEHVTRNYYYSSTVVALAKFIGFRLGTRGRDSVLQFASSLVDDEDLRRRLYVKVRRVCRGKDDRARCEMFIINWARQRLKFENKVRTR